MNKKVTYSIPLMLISPAFVLYKGIRGSDVLYKRWILIIFITMYGSVMTILDSFDGSRHFQKVEEHYMGLEFNEFAKELYHIVSFSPEKETNDDVYIHVISYLTGSVIRIPHLFFVIVAFVYGYFFSGALFKILHHLPNIRYGSLFAGFIVLFILWKNIEGINTVRTWTGLWIMIYGAISYFETKEKKYLILCFLPPLIHVAYLVMAIPLWIVILFGNYKRIYIIIFFLSFVTKVDESVFTRNLEQSKLGQEKLDAYYVESDTQREDKLLTRQESVWYKRLYILGLQDWGVVALAIFLLGSGIYLNQMTRLEASLFSTGILMKSLANYGYFVYALENRSSLIAGVFILASMLLVWQRFYLMNRPLERRIFSKVYLSLSFFLFIPFLVFRIADLLYFVSAYLLALPFVVWINPELNISLRELIAILL